jgi:hypothetical protein
LSSRQRQRSRSRRRGAAAAAFLVALVAGLAAGPAATAAAPARGQVDALFGRGMTLFWEEHYSAAVPLFQRVLDLYDGHPAARRYLAQAQGRAGTPEDRPVPVAAAAGGDGLPVVPLVVGLLVLGAVVPALLARRRAGRLDSN